MLRMKVHAVSDSVILTLEGTLTALWTKELLRVVRSSNKRCRGIVDIRRLSSIAVASKKALQTFNKLGATLIAESMFGRELCEQLKLSRVTSHAIGGGSEKKRPHASAKFMWSATCEGVWFFTRNH